MTAGMIVYNDDGYLQVTEDYKNLVLIGKGTVNLSGAPWVPGAGQQQFGAAALLTFPDTSGVAPLIALRCDTNVVVFQGRLNGGNWEYRIVSTLGQNRSDVVEWFAFGPTPNVSPHNYGLQVFTAAGQLAFHSGYKPMRIGQVAVQGGSTSIALPSGRKVAVAIPSPRWEWSAQLPAGTWQQMVFVQGMRTTGTNTAEIANVNVGQIFQSANFGFGAGSTGQWSAFALDVTGY